MVPALCRGLAVALVALVLTGRPAIAATSCLTPDDRTAGQTAPATPDPVPGTPDPRELPGSDAAARAGGGGAGLQAGAPPWPVPPEVAFRDDQGRVTVRAVKLAAGLRIDGSLDEPVYGCVRAITDFVQVMPAEGAPATEKTEAWIMFDAASIYVSALVWDSAPPADWVAKRDAARHAPAP